MFFRQGKDEAARMAERGAGAGEVVAALRACAPSLSLQQLYKLTEHQHDDWAESAPLPPSTPARMAGATASGAPPQPPDLHAAAAST